LQKKQGLMKADRSEDREKTYLVNGYDIAEANAQVFADDLVHPNLTLLTEVISEDDTDSIFPLLALD
tara:strand:- start:2387 stop:2587 length:201 start_codon:yes stop_codon:yes gene_type:complete